MDALAKQFAAVMKSQQDVAENKRLDGFATNRIKALIALLQLLLDTAGKYTKHFRLVVLKTKDYSHKVRGFLIVASVFAAHCWSKAHSVHVCAMRMCKGRDGSDSSET